MRKLTNEELISVYFAINVHNEYFLDDIMYLENTEYEISQAFESPYEALKAVGDSYSVFDPYFYIFDKDCLVSLTEDQFVDVLRAHETEIVDIYEALVEQGEIEDFLNLAEGERELTDDQLMEVFEVVGPFGEVIDATTNDEDGFERLFKNGLEVARAVKYGDYDFTEPYIYLGGDGNLYSMDEDEFLAMLKDNKDELMEAYDKLVSDGYIEDFLNKEE